MNGLGAHANASSTDSSPGAGRGLHQAINPTGRVMIFESHQGFRVPAEVIDNYILLQLRTERFSSCWCVPT